MQTDNILIDQLFLHGGLNAAEKANASDIDRPDEHRFRVAAALAPFRAMADWSKTFGGQAKIR